MSNDIHIPKFLLIFLCIGLNLMGQYDRDTIYIRYSETNPKNKIIKTDSSIIEINFYPEFGYMMEINTLKKRDRKYFRTFDLGTKKLIETGAFEDGNGIGKFETFSNMGIHLWTVNYEDATLTEHMGYFPFKAERDFIKSRADSLLIANFGRNFFETNIRWNPNQSYFGGNSRPGHWFAIAYSKPKTFILRYYVLWDKKKYSTIEFQLDSMGTVTTRVMDTKGIRKCEEPSGDCKFNITPDQSKELAIKNGMKQNDDKQLIYLSYNPEIKHSGYGDYEIIVADYLRVEKKSKDYFIHYYDGLVIDPWTGLVKERVQLSQFTGSNSYMSVKGGLKRVK